MEAPGVFSLEWLFGDIGGLEFVVLGAVFASVVLVVLGAAALAEPRDPVSRRFGERGSGAATANGVELRVAAREERKRGIWGFVLPEDDRERSAVRRRLWRAGWEGPNVVRNYFAVRTGLALVLPLPVAGTLLFTSFRIESGAVQFNVAGIAVTGPLILTLVLIVIGFYGPSLVVGARIDARQDQIRRAFPGALDLMQLSVEAGLGVDAAIAKVAQEMALAQPALAREFALILVELRAGKPRDTVLADFAERTGVEEIRSFATVLQQTVEFGTNMAEALRTFADEMRRRRMLLAEEKANKLSVKLSAVVVTLMMPAILTMIMGPVIIRTIRVIMPAVGGP
jgi:tight adherence protein C